MRLALILLLCAITSPVHAQGWADAIEQGLACFEQRDADCVHAKLLPLLDLPAAEQETRPDLVIRGLTALGIVERMKRGDARTPIDLAIALHDRTAPPPRAVVIPALLERAAAGLAYAQTYAGDPVANLRALEAAVAIQLARETADATLPADHPQVIDIRMAEAAASVADQNWDEARMALRDSVNRLDERDEVSGRLSWTLSSLAHVEYERDDLEASAEATMRAILVMHQIGDRQGWMNMLQSHAALLRQMGHCEEARLRWEELEEARDQPGLADREMAALPCSSRNPRP